MYMCTQVKLYVDKHVLMYASCMCTQVKLCVGTSVLMHACKWKTKDNLRFCSSGFVNLFFDSGSLIGLELAKQAR